MNKTKAEAFEATKTRAELIAERLAARPKAIFTSADGVWEIEHKPVGVEAFIAMKNLPSKFTMMMKGVYEKAINGKTVEAQAIDMNMSVEEFDELLSSLLIETAISPKFLRDVEDAPKKDIFNVETAREIWLAYYAHVLDSVAPVTVKGGVSSETLATFPDSGE